MTFERRVAALYLARLLTGAPATELEGRRVSKVVFQTAPAQPVDDLVIYAARDGEADPSLELAVAVRRTPKFVTSDIKTAELLTKFLRTLRDAEQVSPSMERLFAICVAGAQTPSGEVAKLAALAKDHQAGSFFSVLRTPRKFRKELVTRLDHLVNLVKKGLAALGEGASVDIAEHTTWSLLARLHVLMPRVEAPDETDWDDLLRILEPWSSDQSLSAAAALRDRLEALAARYAPNAAVVELPELRRTAHDALRPDRHRNHRGWAELMKLDRDAREAVRSEMGLGPTPTRLHLARRGEAEALRKRLENDPCVLISGESGVGKSALVLSELSASIEADQLRLQVVFLNLRLMPSTISDLRSAIGCAIEEVLQEMSAPTRRLVIDAAEYIVESNSGLLNHLVRAAKSSDMGVWLITSTEGRAAVRAVVETILTPVIEHEVSFLTDEDLKEVVTVFPQLHNLVANAHSRELLRRPVVTDLLVRADSGDHPLSDADAWTIVWDNLIRAGGRTERGTPDARDQVFRRLARHQLQPRSSASELYESLNSAALDGLRRDGLIRLSSAARWQVLPEFSHDLLRTYAVCKVLLADGEPVTALLEAGAPRWSLPAARLAAQVLLATPENSEVPMDQSFERVQADFERLAAAGHGQRWSDLPTEAVLPLPQAGEMLGGAWKNLLKEDAQGLRRVLRVIQQRHQNNSLVAPLVAEPLVDLLLDRNWPKEPDLEQGVDKLLHGWLRALIVAKTPAGQELRLKLRRSIVRLVQHGDSRLAEEAAKEVSELAARTPEQVREDEERTKELSRSWVPWVGDSRKRWVEMPEELIREATIEILTLLGPDLGEDGEELLRRVAREAPHYLAPSLDDLFAGRGLASYRPSLLTELVEAYYLDTCVDDFGMHDHNYGIRDHHCRNHFGPLCAFYKGPFLAMLQADFRNGVVCLNKLLNHAAKVRVAVLQESGAAEELEAGGDYQTALSITGEPRIYIGDSHVWRWYRGTGVGPYPCMSALQALEVVCDQFIQNGAAPECLAAILIHDCENLAMPALVVGLLVRHLEEVGEALDPFLSEPTVWRFEFERVIGEYSILVAGSESLKAPERRNWSLREAAMLLVLRSEGERIDSLRELGRDLIDRARQLEVNELKTMPGNGGGRASLSEGLAAVHAWAASLDRDSYQVTEQEGLPLIQPTVPVDVHQVLEPGNRDLSRGNQAIQLVLRYAYQRHHSAGPPKVSLAELILDLATARELLSDPPTAGPSGSLAAPAAVAAGALELFFVSGEAVASEDLVWSIQLLVELVKLYESVEKSDDYYSLYIPSPDRSAARGIPFVFLPAAADLRTELGASGITPTDLTDAARWLAVKAPLEAQLLYAQAIDLRWRAPCDAETPGKCHHGNALELIEASARDCLKGSWDLETRRSKIDHLKGPLDQAIAVVADDKIIVPRLSPAIRALGVAAHTPSCCTDRAKALLAALLAAHRRGMAAHRQRYMHSSSDALVGARALLVGVANNSEDLLREHVKHYVDDPGLLEELLRALAAAAEENRQAANAARRIWPKLIDQVLDAIDAGRRSSRHLAGLAALIPNRAYEAGYLRRELEAEPIDWIDLMAWRRQVERWLPFAAGSSRCIDSLVKALGTVTEADQAGFGLPWVEVLVQADPQEMASRSWLLPNWLREVQPYARSREEGSCWQRVVDMLVVAGDTRVADLSD